MYIYVYLLVNDMKNSGSVRNSRMESRIFRIQIFVLFFLAWVSQKTRGSSHYAVSTLLSHFRLTRIPTVTSK